MSGRVDILLLAAGASRRMGRCKALLPLGDTPVIVRCLASLIAAGLRDGVVVTGAEADAVEEAIRDYPLRPVRNPVVDADMAGSIRAGLAALPGDASGIMVCLADQPLIMPETYRLLAREHLLAPGRILIPVFEERRGHPTLFPSALLQPMQAGGTLRDVIRGHAQAVLEIPVDDAGVVIDMDTPADYQRLQMCFETRFKTP